MIVRFITYNIYGMGGTVRTVINTANYLIENGYKVEIISLKKTSKKAFFTINKNIKLRPIIDYTRVKRGNVSKEFIKTKMLNYNSILFNKNEDLYDMFSLYLDYRLYKILKSIKSGVLVTTMPSLNILAAKYVDDKVIKIGQEHKSFSIHDKSLKEEIKKNYGRLDCLTCLTDKDVEEYKEIGKEIKLLKKIENATRIQYQSSTLKNKTIIAAGRFSEEKGFDLLIEAFSKAYKNSKDKDWILKIYGNGKLKGKYQDLIIEHKMSNNIRLMPMSNKLIEDIKNSSIYALSSRNEGFGMVIIEAMSVGVPTIAFECDGPKEIIEHNSNGILVEKNDINEFSKELIRLMENDKERKILGKQCKLDYKKYSNETIGRKWDYLIKEIKKKKKKEEIL